MNKKERKELRRAYKSLAKEYCTLCERHRAIRKAHLDAEQQAIYLEAENGRLTAVLAEACGHLKATAAALEDYMDSEKQG